MKKKFKNLLLYSCFLALTLVSLSSCSFVSNIVSNTIVDLTITDSRSTYAVGEVYNNTNGLTVMATYSNNKTSDITSSGNYTIVLKNSYNSTVDETESFTSTGQYEVYVRYLLITSNTLTFTVSGEASSADEEQYNYDSTVRQNPNTVFSNKDIMQNSYGNYCGESTGKVKALVIPVQISGYNFQSTILDDIDKTFNGSSSDTNYFESVSSYYYKSSYGKLDMEFTVAPVYESSYTARQIKNYNNETLMNKAVADFSANNDMTQFDSDSDGYIDLMWFVYSSHNCSQDSTLYDMENGNYETFWAYSTDISNVANVNSPVAHNIGWASYDFMFEVSGFKRQSSNTKFDAHTFIHETGHLLGLDDYYSYASNVNVGPLGGLDMMDFNIGDHDAFSKMLLGWTNPYVVSGDVTKQTYTISSSSTNNDAILICNNWNGTVFDEYLLVEFYTPDGVNKVDSATAYSGGNKMFSTYGIRIYHVDNRLLKFTYNRGEFTAPTDASNNVVCMNDTEVKTITTIPKNSDKSVIYAITNSNTQTDDYSYDTRFSLIQAITANKVNTLKNKTVCSNQSLFKEGDSFTMDEYGKYFFYNGTKFNNGDNFDYKISVDSLSSSQATITVEKI